MISGFTIFLMVLEGLIPLFLVAAIIIYAYKTGNLALQAVGIGIVIFFVFSQILEKLMHVMVLGLNPGQSPLLHQPLLFALYGGLAAGVFEEIGRYVGFRVLLKNRRDWKIGFSYGIGHGGFEAVLIGLSVIQSLTFAYLINAGRLQEVMGSKLPASAIQQIKSSMLHMHGYMFLIGGLERIPALAIQLFLSLLVLYAVRSGRFVLVIAAILYHALADFGAGLAQAHGLPFWGAELWAWVFGVLSFYLLARSRKWFADD